MGFDKGSGSVRQGGGQTRKRGNRILVLRSIAGYLVAPGLAANIFESIGYKFFGSYSYDSDLMSMTFGLISLWGYIIIPLFSLPWHIYFAKNGKATLGNYMLLWASIAITTDIIGIAVDPRECYRGFACSITTVSDLVPELRLVLIGCLGGLIFWFIACWRHDFNAADRTP